MSFLAVVAHGATGTWLDEIVEIGIPLVVLVVLYWWSNRKPRPQEARATSDSFARSELDERSRGGEAQAAKAGRAERDKQDAQSEVK